MARQYEEIFEKLLDKFVVLGENLPRVLAYQEIFNSQRFQTVVSKLFLDVIEFCTKSIKFFMKPGKLT